MRISDWSSDVCSSDLDVHITYWHALGKQRTCGENLELFDAADSGRRVTKPLLALVEATLLVDGRGTPDLGRGLLAQDMETNVDRQIVILRHVQAVKGRVEGGGSGDRTKEGRGGERVDG